MALTKLTTSVHALPTGPAGELWDSPIAEIGENSYGWIIGSLNVICRKPVVSNHCPQCPVKKKPVGVALLTTPECQTLQPWMLASFVMILFLAFTSLSSGLRNTYATRSDRAAVSEMT